MADSHVLDTTPLLDATAWAVALRDGSVGCVDLVERHLARVDELDERLGAFVTRTPEAALAAAAAADTRLVAARRDGSVDRLPPLFGVPTAVKDLADTAGVRTTLGSAVFADRVPETDAEIVVRIRAAGLISLGKTNTPEFGCPCYTEPDVAPPARTPWDPTRSAGGSSGGAGAAVAAGLVPLAHATDGGGSIRIPASVCGLVGLKPSRGRISGAPSFGDVLGLATQGCLTRTVRDSAAFLDAVAGPSTGEPSWAPPLPRGRSFRAACDVEPPRLRIGRCLDPVLAAGPVDPACVAAYEEASALLESLGHEVVDVPLALAPGTGEQFLVVWGVLAALTPVPADREHLLRPLTRWLRGVAGGADAMTLAHAQIAIRGAAARILESTAGFDAVLTPTLAGLPATVGGLRDDADPERDFFAQSAWTPWTALWNMTGSPAISLPLSWHRTAAGTVLPVGIMLAGRPAGEEALLSLAAQLERARPWAHRQPPVPMPVPTPMPVPVPVPVPR